MALSGVAAVLFLGGYQGLPDIPLPGPIWMFAKIGALSFFVIWLRATYPRLREDQLQRFAWFTLIPLSLVWILGVAVVRSRSSRPGRRGTWGSDGADVRSRSRNPAWARACSRASASPSRPC